MSLKSFQGNGVADKGLKNFYQGNSTNPFIDEAVVGVIDMAFGLQAYKYNPLRVPNNINYTYYRPITIQTSANLLPVGTTVDLVFDHAAMVTSGESDELGKELRLTYRPNDSAEKEIDAEILNPNTSTATLRFKTQRIIAASNSVMLYRLYTKIIRASLFEETFRDRLGVYYFHANRLTASSARTNGTWTTYGVNSIRRVTDGNEARLGFNVPTDCDVEVDFRFLDDGQTNQSRYIGLDWRGNNTSSQIFRLDNDSSVSNNQILNYFNGTTWTPLGAAIPNAKTEVSTLRVNVIGSTIKMYANNVLLTTITEAGPATGGMQIILPNGSESVITGIRVKNADLPASVLLGAQSNNLKYLNSSTKLLLSDTTSQAIQSNIIRLKRFPDGTIILEDARMIGEWGDNYPATTGQFGSLELHLYQIGQKSYATVTEFNT